VNVDSGEEGLSMSVHVVFTKIPRDEGDKVAVWRENSNENRVG
jgi:hypothetical protein